MGALGSSRARKGQASKGREGRLVTEPWAAGGGRSTRGAVPRPGLWGGRCFLAGAGLSDRNVMLITCVSQNLQ